MSRVLYLHSKDHEKTIKLEGVDLVGIEYDVNYFKLNKDKSEDELVYKFVSDLAKQDSFSHILVEVKEKDINTIIRMICHIRLNSSLNLSALPIIVTGNTEFDDVVSSIPECSVFNCGGIKYIPISEDVLTDLLIDYFSNYDYIKPISRDQFRKNAYQFSKLTIPELKGDSHQIANEWGAYKLGVLMQDSETLFKIESSIPKSKTLYFQYLKNELEFNLSGRNIGNIGSVTIPISPKFLLIDDNYNKGWSTCLSKLTELVYSNSSLDAFEGFNILSSNEPRAIDSILDLIKTNKYNLVFLDLRLLISEENELFTNTGIEKFSGGRILKRIKETFPEVSVLILTASNKAWNISQLLNMGADGFYIKEHPQFSGGIVTSKNNLDNFINSITYCINKNTSLTWFWKTTNEIQIAINNGDSLIVEKNNSQIGNRIIERLKMSYGLLKTNFEQSDFNNKMFYLSDVELAFITFWSCLNDLQYSYFSKTGSNNQPIWNLENDIVTKFGSTNTYNFLNSGLDSTSRRKETTCLNIDDSHSLKFLKNNSSDPLFQNSLSTFGRFSTNISIQIAYLIYATAELNNLPDNDRDILLEFLAKFNKKRNHLYITHGDEKENGYFSKTIQNKREENISKINIDDNRWLLKIIYFLIVGRTAS